MKLSWAARLEGARRAANVARQDLRERERQLMQAAEDLRNMIALAEEGWGYAPGWAREKWRPYVEIEAARLTLDRIDESLTLTEETAR